MTSRVRLPFHSLVALVVGTAPGGICGVRDLGGPLRRPVGPAGRDQRREPRCDADRYRTCVGSFFIDKDLTLTAGGSTVTLDGNRARIVVAIRPDVSLTLDRLIITGGGGAGPAASRTTTAP
jgi:hypothetical protein